MSVTAARTENRSKLPRLSGTVAVTALLIASTLLVVAGPAGQPPPHLLPSASPSSLGTGAWTVDALRSSQLSTVRDSEPGLGLPGAIAVGPPSVSSLLILVSFPIQHSPQLTQFLHSLADPTSTLYHQYLTASAFDAAYGGNAIAYAAADAYFQSFGVAGLQTSADRLSLTFRASPTQIQEIFHTSIEQFALDGRTYVAPTGSPELPSELASAILSVEGLSSYSGYVFHTLGGHSISTFHGPPTDYEAPPTSAQGYLQPATVNGVQLEFGPDLQVAYDEQSLFAEAGYPTNAVIATILVGGCSVAPAPSCPTGDIVAPWDPNDIYTFYNETIPAGEPHASVYGVPVDGALPPGASAQYDQSGAQDENTLDLEMAGSTAPGASIYNVYGPDFSDPAYLDGAFSYILNPTNTPALSHVSVISNSWGGTDTNDSAWYSDLQEAAARGISVLASSGDGGDNPSSSKGCGSMTCFPASMSYNSFGMTAVGGTTVTLNPTPSSPSFLHIVQQTAWYISSADTADGGPAGTEGGLSLNYSEPSWQQTTSANAVIQAAAVQEGIPPGRGVPDIAAIANNTLLTITVNGTRYLATNALYGGPYFPVWGTSIASPVEAGIVAEINHVLEGQSNPVLGFLNPNLYALATYEYAPLQNSSNGITGFSCTGPGNPPTCPYASAFPTLPVLDVQAGGNYYYPATRGYDLATGWGSIDAYNYTMYFLSVNSNGVNGRLSGVEDLLNLSGLAVTSTGCLGGPCVSNASIQQNFFLANALGAPVYWVQNVIYIMFYQGQWYMSYTGWVIFPFYGLYPTLAMYEYNFPNGTFVSLPHTFDIQTLLTTNGYLDGEYVAFTVGSQTIDIAVPAAAYIIGSLSYQYSWQGVTYTNGPYPNNPNPGGLAPQFGLVGGPTLGTGDFSSPTSGSLTATVLPYGASSFVPASTQSFGENIDQTGEAAQNLSWTQQSGNQWSLGTLSGSAQQGVLSYEPSGAAMYPVTFTESGLPAGTSWSVTLNGATQSSTGSSISFNEANGTYSFTIGAVSGYSASPSSGSVTVNGAAVSKAITFSAVAPTTYTVTFTESGLPSGASWSVTLNGGTSSSTTSTITFNEANGAYNYTVGPVTGYTASPSSGTVTVNGAAVTESITFTSSSSSSSTSYSQAAGLVVTAASGYAGGGWQVLAGAALAVVTPTTVASSTFYNQTSPGCQVTWIGTSRATFTFPATLPSASVGTANAWVFELTQGSGSTVLVVTVDNGTATLQYTVSPGSCVNSGSNAAIPTGIIDSPAAVGAANSAGGTAFLTTYPSSTRIWEVFSNTTLPGSHTFWAVIYTTCPLVGGSGPGHEFVADIDAVSGAVDYSGASSLTCGPPAIQYTVTFTETGLPSGTTWSVTLNGTTVPSTTSTITFSEPNGTYAYTIGSVPGYQVSSSGGTLTVAGGSVTEGVTFTASPPPTYAVMFAEVGLASGTSWSVVLNGVTSSTTGSSLAFNEPNGTYAFTVETVSGYTASPSSGTVTVNGGTITETISFAVVAPTTYTVTFTETGLAPGTSWSVTLNGNTAATTGSSIAFSEANGTYSYTVGTVAGYTAGPSVGAVTVSGASLTESITFTARAPTTYTVTFTESGFPSGTSWSVTLNGATSSSTASTILFTEANGTYSFTVGAVSGYSASPSSGGVTVNGAAVNQGITFTGTGGGGGTGGGFLGLPAMTGYYLLGGVVAAVVAGAVVALLASRARRAGQPRASPPPPTPPGPGVIGGGGPPGAPSYEVPPPPTAPPGVPPSPTYPPSPLPSPPLTPGPPPPPSSSPPASGTPPSRFCSSCGQSFTGSERFCGSCGKPR